METQTISEYFIVNFKEESYLLTIFKTEVKASHVKPTLVVHLMTSMEEVGAH